MPRSTAKGVVTGISGVSHWLILFGGGGAYVCVCVYLSGTPSFNRTGLSTRGPRCLACVWRIANEQELAIYSTTPSKRAAGFRQPGTILLLGALWGRER